MNHTLHPRLRFLRYALACSHELLGISKISQDDYHELEMMALLHKKDASGAPCVPEATLLEKHYPNAHRTVCEIAECRGIADPWTHEIVSEFWHIRHRTDDTPTELFVVELSRADGHVFVRSDPSDVEETYHRHFYDKYALRLPEGSRVWAHINWIIESADD